MTVALARAGRLAFVLAAVTLVVTLFAPAAMQTYSAFSIGAGITGGCTVPRRSPAAPPNPCERPVTALYNDAPLAGVVLDAATRSLALLVGAAILALTLGLLAGVTAALLRKRAVASGAILGGVSVFAAIPSFFFAYFLQMGVIFLAGVAGTGRRVLPVFGFGYDEHMILPLLALGIPAVAITAQVAAARVADVLDADFITTARAKGLFDSQVLRTHVMPHALPVVLEAVGSGLRISVASLVIIEYLFVWNGIGYLALQSIASKDVAALTASIVALATLFALIGLLLEARRSPATTSA